MHHITPVLMHIDLLDGSRKLSLQFLLAFRFQWQAAVFHLCVVMSDYSKANTLPFPESIYLLYVHIVRPAVLPAPGTPFPSSASLML